jgi:hypothetical protein
LLLLCSSDGQAQQVIELTKNTSELEAEVANLSAGAAAAAAEQQKLLDERYVLQFFPLASCGLRKAVEDRAAAATATVGALQSELQQAKVFIAEPATV